MAIEIKVPELGESITDVQIADWQKAEGDRVRKDETLVTIDSEKASVDVPAPAEGTLVEILKANGEDAKVGEAIGRIEPSKDGTPAGTATQQEKTKGTKTGRAAKRKAARAGAEGSKPSGAGLEDKSEGPRVMPAAQRLLDKYELHAEDVEATGAGGRLLKEDVLAHLESADQSAEQAETRSGRTEGSRPAAGEGGLAPHESGTGLEPVGSEGGPVPSRTGHGRDEEVKRMTPLRRTVARRLVEAQRSMAILTTFNEIDMSAVIALRKEFREPFEQRHGVRLGFMSFFVKAVVAGLQEVPRLNSEVRGDDMVLHRYFDIGVAIGAGKGLVVPPLRNAERLSFADIEKTIADLAGRAQENKLTPQELQGGTFTISNGGVYGSLLSTPIINPPQSGILGLHAIQDRPVVRDGQVVIRPMMYVALSYDHRLVDGREAVTFLRRVKELIETPARLMLEA